MSYVIGRVGGSAAKLPENIGALLGKGHELMPDAEWWFMPGDAALKEYAQDKPWVKVYDRDAMPVPEFLRQCDIFWFPVADKVHDQGPRVIVEAMAAGLPVVAENRDGAKDRVHDGVTGFLLNDRMNMPTAIMAIREEGAGPRMGAAGRERARGWTPEAWADHIIGHMATTPSAKVGINSLLFDPKKMEEELGRAYWRDPTDPARAGAESAPGAASPGPYGGAGAQAPTAVQSPAVPLSGGQAAETPSECGPEPQAQPVRRARASRRFLVHIRGGQGLGNICCAVPTIKALAEMGTVDVWNQAGYPEVISAIDGVLMHLDSNAQPHCSLVPDDYDAIVPLCYFGGIPGYPELEAKVPKIRFDRWQTSETRANFLRAVALGYEGDMPDGLIRCPIPDGVNGAMLTDTVIFADCAHKGKAEQKRWPWWTILAERFRDGLTLEVGWVGQRHDTVSHAIDPQLDLRGHTSLSELMYAVAHARLVIANDCGVAHLACAMGTDTLILFGPTNDVKNKPESPHAHVLRSSHLCQDCQKNKVPGSWECPSACLKALTPDEVYQEAMRILGNA